MLQQTFLDDLADEDFGEAGNDLRDWLRDLLSSRLLDDLRQRNGYQAQTGCGNLGRTFRTACLGRACLRYASKRSYC